MKQPLTPGGLTCEAAQRMIALRAMSASDGDIAAESLSDPVSDISPDFADILFGDLSDEPLDPLPFSAVAQEADAGLKLPAGLDPLEEHLRSCRDCQSEMAATTAFFRALATEGGPEPSATLLARARIQLDASLDSCEHAGLFTRLGSRFSFTMGRLRAAPALASALLFIGVLAGAYGGYHAGLAAHNDEQTTLLLAPPPQDAPSIVADVSSIRREPDTGLIEVRYDRLVPDVLTAAPGDPSIRELLMAGAENGVDPTVRDASLSLLSGRCSSDEDCAQAPVRSALLNALATDKAPEVRREALAELEPFIADDVEVRDAVLGALMNDPSASVRIEAVRLLQPVDVDSSVRQVLHTVAASDGDPKIRSASLQVLSTMPALQ